MSTGKIFAFPYSPNLTDIQQNKFTGLFCNPVQEIGTGSTPNGYSNAISDAVKAYNSTISGFVNLGTWNANTNTPTLTSGAGTTNGAYVVSTAGTTSLDGNNSWAVGNVAYFDGTVWHKYLNGNYLPSNRDIGMYRKKNVVGTDINIEESIAKPQVLKALTSANASTNFPTTAGDGILLYSSLSLNSGNANKENPDLLEFISSVASIFTIDVLIFPGYGSGMITTMHPGFTSTVLDANGALIGVNYDTTIYDPRSQSYIVRNSLALSAANQRFEMSMIGSLFPFSETTKSMQFLIVARYTSTPSVTATISEDVVSGSSDEVRAVIHRKQPIQFII